MNPKKILYILTAFVVTLLPSGRSLSAMKTSRNFAAHMRIVDAKYPQRSEDDRLLVAALYYGVKNGLIFPKETPQNVIDLFMKTLSNVLRNMKEEKYWKGLDILGLYPLKICGGSFVISILMVIVKKINKFDKNHFTTKIAIGAGGVGLLSMILTIVQGGLKARRLYRRGKKAFFIATKRLQELAMRQGHLPQGAWGL